MTRVTVLAGAAAAVILLGMAALGAAPRMESDLAAFPPTVTIEKVLLK